MIALETVLDHELHWNLRGPLDEALDRSMKGWADDKIYMQLYRELADALVNSLLDVIQEEARR